jgi:hypothetical protein
MNQLEAWKAKSRALNVHEDVHRVERALWSESGLSGMEHERWFCRRVLGTWSCGGAKAPFTMQTRVLS